MLQRITFVLCVLQDSGVSLNYTAWKKFKYGPEKSPYLNTFHAVIQNVDLFAFLKDLN